LILATFIFDVNGYDEQIGPFVNVDQIVIFLGENSSLKSVRPTSNIMFDVFNISIIEIGPQFDS
jgi:hypothetical protein